MNTHKMKNIVFDHWLNFLINYIKKMMDGEMLTKNLILLNKQKKLFYFYWYDVNVRN